LFTARLSSQIQVFNFFFSANLSKPGIQLLNSEFVSDLEFSISNPGSDLIFSFSNPGLFEFQVWNKPGIEKLNSRFTLKSPKFEGLKDANQLFIKIYFRPVLEICWTKDLPIKNSQYFNSSFYPAFSLQLDQWLQYKRNVSLKVISINKVQKIWIVLG
jgi:hypothetical protein